MLHNDPAPWCAPDTLDCPVADTLAMLAGKWKPMMLHMLLTRDLHFEEIVRALAGVNRKVVNEQLGQLVEAGLVTRTAYSDGRQRSLYSLSGAGSDLAVILGQMRDWSLNNRAAY